jgi:hypothetical protein
VKLPDDFVVTPLQYVDWRQYTDMCEVPNGYCPIHATGVKLPDDFKVTPLQYVE